MEIEIDNNITEAKPRRKVVRYATKERMERVNKDSLKAYDKYLSSSIASNPDVKETTYKVYQSNFNIFLCYLLEYWDNMYVLDKEILESEGLMDDTYVDVIEAYMNFCREELGNNKKAINNKIAAISSFFLWCVDRRVIRYHPFPNLKRMQNAQDEKIIAEDYLTLEQVEKVYEELDKVFEEGYTGKYDPLDAVIWAVSYYSAGRVKAISSLKFSQLVYDPEEGSGFFQGVREKRGKIVDLLIDDKAFEVLTKYVAWREERGIETDYVIASLHDGEWGAMTPGSIAIRVRAIGHIVGLEHFRPHSIRKTRGSIVGLQDPDLARMLLNHDDVSTTMKHYVKPQTIASAIGKIKLADKGKLKEKP